MNLAVSGMQLFARGMGYNIMGGIQKWVIRFLCHAILPKFSMHIRYDPR